jgi:hypothetical protein
VGPGAGVDAAEKILDPTQLQILYNFHLKFHPGHVAFFYINSEQQISQMTDMLLIVFFWEGGAL